MDDAKRRIDRIRRELSEGYVHLNAESVSILLAEVDRAERYAMELSLARERIRHLEALLQGSVQ